jgi:hypothetical protein
MDRNEMRAWIREHRVCWELSPRYEGPDRPRYEIEPFDGAVHLRPETSFALELDVAILHRGATFAEADARDRRTAAEIGEALKGLGVQPRTWRTVENLNTAR